MILGTITIQITIRFLKWVLIIDVIIRVLFDSKLESEKKLEGVTGELLDQMLNQLSI